MQELKLSDVINIDPMSSLNCMLNLLQHAEETNKNKEHATATVGL